MPNGQSHSFHGLELPVRVFGGARGLRIVHPAGQRIPAHRHDWPLLTLPALGGYEEECDAGAVAITGPAVVLHPAGLCHANCIHDRGMETFSIEFDPDWVRIAGFNLPLDRSHFWIGGEVVLAARKLTQAWIGQQPDESAMQKATASFLTSAMNRKKRPPPRWFDRVRDHVTQSECDTASGVARRLGMHPRWFAHAYRTAAGEGFHEHVRRLRIEQAVHLLRSTDEPIASIAVAAGFCDQSHLNRILRQATGRTPVQIRAERDLLSRLMVA